MTDLDTFKYPCPHCNKIINDLDNYFPWEAMKDGMTACIPCPHCGEEVVIKCWITIVVLPVPSEDDDPPEYDYDWTD